MDVPNDEDGLIAFIVKRFEDQKEHYETLDAKYDNGRKYPDRGKGETGYSADGKIFSFPEER